VTPLLTWRSRLPAAIGSWFARDLVRTALAIVAGGRVALRTVEEQKIDAVVRDGPRGETSREVAVEWGSGTGPLALRTSCSCGASGMCEHVVATLDAVRSQSEVAEAPAADDLDLTWLPAPRLAGGTAVRARSIWVVFSSVDGTSLQANLVLDSPRLKGVVRDAPAILSMMESTPTDDWDEADRELARDELAHEAFAGRPASRALSRALFRLTRHPRLRFDTEPSVGRHPSELASFTVDPRGLSLRAVRVADGFIPLFDAADGLQIAPRETFVLDGPPMWIATTRAVYLHDGSFDAAHVITASRALADAPPARGEAPPLTLRTIGRVAPYLAIADRTALGIADAAEPTAEIACGWSSGAIVAGLTFIDRATKVRAPFAPFGGIAAHGGGFVRFSPEYARDLRARLLAAGFVPRGGDGFALHGADRAATFVRDVLPTWTDLERRIDANLRDVAEGTADVELAVSAVRAGGAAGPGDWFDLSVDVFVDGTENKLSEAELAALLASSGRYAEVRGKLVDVAKLRARNSLIGEISERRRSGFAALLALRDELHENFANVSLPPEVEELRARLRDFDGIPVVEAPKLAQGELRGYQQRGLDFLSYLSSFDFGGVLADEMGLGKTLQVIAYLQRRKEHEGRSPSLVIAPTSVTHTWENEIARFAPSLRTLRLHSGAERAAHFGEIDDADVVITSYALARLDAERLGATKFRALILDEAQNAKNPSSQIARVVRGLRADHRLALTGTPVENSLRDLWAIFAFVEPGLLGSEGSFRRRFELPIAADDPIAAETLRSRLEPFLLRRTKEDVAPELPARTEVSLECELSPLQRRLYRGVAEAARRDIFAMLDADGMQATSVHVLAALTRLRQICAHPGLLFEEHRTDPEASAKFEAFLETVDEVLSGGHRLLVFSAFASMLRIMRARFDEKQIAYGYLDGTTKDKDRRTEVERFMEPDGPPLFLCSLKAGGVGLTLTAADYVVLYDPWWNPAVERQAIDRTHRIGQTRAVTAYRLVTRGTVEEKIRELAERKSSLAKSVIKADGALAKALTREDLELLFADPTE